MLPIQDSCPLLTLMHFMQPYSFDRHCQSKEINRTGPRAAELREEEVGYVYSMETIENKLSKLLARVKYKIELGGNQVSQL